MDELVFKSLNFYREPLDKKMPINMDSLDYFKEFAGD